MLVPFLDHIVCTLRFRPPFWGGAGEGRGGGRFGLWRVLILNHLNRHLVPCIYLINLLGVTTFKISTRGGVHIGRG